MRGEVLLRAGGKHCPIYIGRGDEVGLYEELTGLCPSKKVFVITDSNVERLYSGALCRTLDQNGFTARCHAVPAGEASKSLAEAGRAYEAMIRFGMTRGDAVLAVGGGVAGDLGGFAAATFLRGVPCIQIPTTLLAQVDSSVGGKTAVNLPQGKNQVGVFCQPQAVFIDTERLESLPGRYFRDGMAEVIKYGFIGDDSLLTMLEGLGGRAGVMEHAAEIVSRCCSMKRDIVERDERDRGERMLLNFGHTFGHAVESLSGYGYSHGESVAIGMYAAGKLGEMAGVTEPGTSARIKNLLSRYGLPHKLPEMDRRALGGVMARDKKNLGGKIKFILLESPGKAVMHEAAPEFADRLLAGREEA